MCRAEHNEEQEPGRQEGDDKRGGSKVEVIKRRDYH